MTAAKKKTTTRTRKSKATKEKKRKMKPGDERFVDEVPFKDVDEKPEPKEKDENARPPMTRGRKLNADRVREIRQLLGSGKKCKEIAGLFDVHESTIDDIRCSRTWASLD